MKNLYTIILTLALCSCSRGLYIPNKVNSPGLRRKGDAKLDISGKFQENALYSPAKLSMSIATDLAYALTSHIGIIGSYGNLNKVSGYYPFYSNSSPYVLTGHHFELGVGYYYEFSEGDKFEVYTGYGMGNMNDDGNKAYPSKGNIVNPEQIYQAAYHRFFIQSAVGFQGKAFAVMVGARLTFQQYDSFRSPDPNLINTVVSYSHESIITPLLGFFAPYLQLQKGYKFINVNIQGGFTIQTAGLDVLPTDKQILPYMSIGLVFNYSPSSLHKKKKPSSTSPAQDIH